MAECLVLRGLQGHACCLFRQTLSWSVAAGAVEKLAESVVLRGAQRGGRTLAAQEAAAALDAALMQESKHNTLSVPVELQAIQSQNGLISLSYQRRFTPVACH